LAVHEGDSGDGVLVVAVVLVLISPFNQFLLGLFQTEWSNEAISVICNVDVGHVSRIVDPGLPLEWAEILTILLLILDLVRGVVLALVDISCLAMALDGWHAVLVGVFAWRLVILPR